MSERKRKLSTYRSKTKIKKLTADRNDKKKEIIVVLRYERISSTSSDEYVNVLDESNGEISGNETEGEVLSGPSDVDNDLNESHESNTEDINGKADSFKEKCVEELCNHVIMTEIVDKMWANGNLLDFMNLIRLLQSGRLPADNIVLQLLFDRVRFQTCGNTVSMRYRDVTKTFWSTVYRLCKGSGLKFFGGEKNWGQVVTKHSIKSRYSPDLSKVNFAVPDEKILRDMKKVLPKIIPPGKIRKTIDMIAGKKDLVPMADGKLVTKGLRNEFSGDVDLFGHETEPNILELKKFLEKQLDFICNVVENFPDSTAEDKFNAILELVEMVTQMIRNVRQIHVRERQKFLAGKYPTQLEKAISSCKMHIYTSSVWIKKALDVNLKLFQFLAELQNNMHVFQLEKKLDICTAPNVRLLNDSQYVSAEIDKNEYTHLIQKHSEDWIEFMKQSLVTDDTISDALGLNGCKCLKKHEKNFIMDDYDDEMFQQTSKAEY